MFLERTTPTIHRMTLFLNKHGFSTSMFLYILYIYIYKLAESLVTASLENLIDMMSFSSFS